jgi:8-oxo-dGTP diphosphatase
MASRSPATRPSSSRVLLSVDVVLFTARDRTLSALLVGPTPSHHRDRWCLPAGTVRPGESVDDTATRIARETLGSAPSHLEQVAALGGGTRAGRDASLTVVYVGLVPGAGDPKTGSSWATSSEVGLLPARQREEVERAIAAVRAQLDHQPIAFRLLPDLFTLSDLQEIYEILLGRPLHKASFRRALHAAAIVEPTEQWRSEGRGRPAQLFRYAPPRRRRQRRGVRFDSLG